MTPELAGRIQTRLFLFSTIGVVVMLPFALAFGFDLYAGLFYIMVLGFGWDCIYHRLTLFRWERDWPTSVQFISGIWEGLFFYLLTTVVDIPPFNGAARAGAFWIAYPVTFLAIFLASQGPLRVVFPHWRWNGGRVFERW